MVQYRFEIDRRIFDLCLQTANRGSRVDIERKFEPQRYFEWNMMLIVLQSCSHAVRHVYESAELRIIQRFENFSQYCNFSFIYRIKRVLSAQ